MAVSHGCVASKYSGSRRLRRRGEEIIMAVYGAGGGEKRQAGEIEIRAAERRYGKPISNRQWLAAAASGAIANWRLAA